MLEDLSSKAAVIHSDAEGIFRPRLDADSMYRRPLYLSRISAGYPSPCEDWLERELDLNELVIQHPSATIFVRVAGDSMLNACIHPDDVLVVDQSLEPKDGNIVIVALDGELLVKRLCYRKKHLSLVAENSNYPEIKVSELMDCHIWGVVTTVIHRV